MSLLLVKRLVPTELIIFKSLFERRDKIFGITGKQKAFSPPAVQLTALYPDLDPGVTREMVLRLHGPGTMPSRELEGQPLAKQDKNWRVGSDIDDTEFERTYDRMRTGDYAVMEFHGDGVPESVDVHLFSKKEKSDKEMLRALNSLHDEYGTARPGFNVHPLDLLARLDRAKISPNNPLLRRLLDEPVDVLREDAAAGDEEAEETLASIGQGMTPEQFDALRAAREATGRRGEEVYRDHLMALKAAGLISDFIWVSERNPGSPFDFRVTIRADEVRRVEVKSTKRSFMTAMFFSRRELEVAASRGLPYDVVRIFGLDEPTPLLRTAKAVRGDVRKLLAAVACPSGMSPESFRVSPRLLEFGDEEVALEAPAEIAAA